MPGNWTPSPITQGVAIIAVAVFAGSIVWMSITDARSKGEGDFTTNVRWLDVARLASAYVRVWWRGQ